MVWLELVICITIIFFAGRRVAIYGDIIAFKTKLGGLWIGLVLISIITSLPELFTGISAISIVDAPDLTVGNLLGANTFNLLNLAFLDIASRKQSIMNLAGRGQRLTGWFSIILVGVVAFSLLIQPRLDLRLGWLGWTTPIIFILYLLFVRQIFLIERRNGVPKLTESRYADTSLKKTFVFFAVSAVLIAGSGIWLATIGDRIAAFTGLGENFVGSLFIGLTTTLPEITVSYTALRMGSTDLAISNMIGSNMFNMFLVFIDDLIYTKGPIFDAVSPNNLITAGTIIAMTLITLAALDLKPRRFHRVSWYNLPVILVFLVGTYISYRLNI